MCIRDRFRAENASRTESRRARLIRNAGFPCVKGFDGYDWGMASFPADWGREQLMDLGFVDRAEDLVLYGDVGCGKTHMAIATGMLACERGMPVRFFTASSLVMRLRRARDENRLDAELRAIGRARLLVIDELGYLPIDIDGARLLFQVVADSYEKRSVVFTTNLEFGRWGDCLLYTSDAADEEDSVDLGGRRSIKKKKKQSKVMPRDIELNIRHQSKMKKELNHQETMEIDMRTLRPD